MFTTSPHQHERNVTEAANFSARPAYLGTAGGGKETGVVLRSGKSIKAVMPVADALRLAHEIADAVAAHKAQA